MKRHDWLRAGLKLLAGVQVLLGLWILLLPDIFWKWRWVSSLPPYNEHLLRDLGGTNLALAVVLCAAVTTMERRLVLTALVAYLAASVPHLVFHAQHLEPLSAASGAGLMALLGAGVVLPAALLWLAADASAFRGPTPVDYRPGGANKSS
ncbi:hypothetical protein ABT063_25220 [Streptomyces sp. NPDC002838]|uniref:hypothetical protein n=1 Tax=Streptomyces sp. NPDC002838 TaxID=3154436 RepID=UPI00331DEB67